MPRALPKHAKSQGAHQARAGDAKSPIATAQRSGQAPEKPPPPSLEQPLAPAKVVLNPPPSGAEQTPDTASDTALWGGPPDGRAFVAQTLVDLRERVARGEKVCVVYDIDDTLADTRPRSIAVARAFDAARGTQYFNHVEQLHIPRSGKDLATAAGLPPDAAADFAEFWGTKFFDEDFIPFDAPMKNIIRTAQLASAVGARVLYVTGRDGADRTETLLQLQRFGLPDATHDNLRMRTFIGFNTPILKSDILKLLQQEGLHIGWFMTESLRDIGHIQRTQASVPCVLLDSSHADEGEVRADTPVLPREF